MLRVRQVESLGLERGLQLGQCCFLPISCSAITSGLAARMLSTIFAWANGFLSGRFWIGSRMKFSTLYVATRKVCCACAWPSGQAKPTATAVIKNLCNLTMGYLAWMMKNPAAWSAFVLKVPEPSSNFNASATGSYGPATESLALTV